MHERMFTYVASLVEQGAKLPAGDPKVQALLNHPDPQAEQFNALRALVMPAKPAVKTPAPRAGSAKAGAPVRVAPKQSEGGRKARSVRK
jgi:hypothetical protein